MFKFLFAYILAIIPFFSIAQKTGSITIISDDDMPLKIYLDNVKQNDSAVTQIRIGGLTDIWYRVQAINKDTSYISRNLLVAGIDTEPVDVTYKIKRLSNGKVRITLYSMFAPDMNFIGPTDLFVTQIKLPKLTEQETSSPLLVGQKKVKQIVEANYGDSTNVVLKADNKLTKASTINNTKESKNKTESKDIDKSKSKNLSKKDSKNKVEEKAKTEVKNKVPLRKCNGWPITKKDFDLMIKTISESKTESLKLKNAKSLITGSCFLVSQLDDLTALFKDEETKLDFVKFAYTYTIDRPNYFKLEKYFSSSKNKDEFSSIHGE